MTEWIVAILIIAGSLFILVAALGIVKLHDVYMRMHAITKASSLSIVLLVIAMIIYRPSLDSIVGGILLVLFTIATAPIASHMIARVAHKLGVPLSKGAVVDELEEEEDLEE